MNHDERPVIPIGPTKTELIARLRPAAWSELGFLGKDEALDDVIARDAATMARLGLAYDELADLLATLLVNVVQQSLKPRRGSVLDRVDYLRRQARLANYPMLKHPETMPHIDLNNLPDPSLGWMVGDLQVIFTQGCGGQPCPWGCPVFGTRDFLIVNRKTGESVTAPELMPHLIRCHHFFEGLQIPYRTDPQQLARVLELADLSLYDGVDQR